MLTKKTQQLIKSLEHKKFRIEHQLFVVEGKKIISELLEQKKFNIVDLFLAPNAVSELEHSLKDNQRFTCISLKELQNISLLTNSDYGLAIVEMPKHETIPYPAEKETFIMLESVRDPGNLGTILRISDWFGVKNIICSPDCVDVYSPKVIQASMGSFIRINTFYTDIKEYLEKNKSIHIYGTHLDGVFLHNIDIQTPAIIIFGNESKGLSKTTEELLNYKITIPAAPKNGANSLNVASAVSIVLYHFNFSN